MAEEKDEVLETQSADGAEIRDTDIVFDCPHCTLIPSVRRLVWAGKPQLGNAAWGASFPSERALPAGGFGSVHTPSP